MKRITVISGKGGTGKTTVTANLAALAKELVLADCDVDAPNMHLLLDPKNKEERSFIGGKLAVKNESLCTDCGRCYQVCRFAAITPGNFRINPLKCEGCNVCVVNCPNNAISLVEKETGQIFISESKLGPIVHARLKAGGDNSGKLVSEVRKEADSLAEKEDKELILIDGSPGIGCPVIASLNGVDAALIVTEPTKSGLSDLKRVIEVTEHFKIKTMVVINKFDLNQELADEIDVFCKDKGIDVSGRIPFDRVVNEALHKGELLVNYKESSEPALAIKLIWQRIEEFVQNDSKKSI